MGSCTHILYDTKIENNVIIGTCSVVTKGIPGNSMVVGAPARGIGAFDDYVEKYLKSERYSERIKPRGQVVPDELAKFMWEKFDREH